VAITNNAKQGARQATWLKLRAVAVAVVRSWAPNHVAERSAGEHRKNGCAAPTRSVPAGGGGGERWSGAVDRQWPKAPRTGTWRPWPRMRQNPPITWVG